MPFKTNIFRTKTGLIIDITNKDDVLVWLGITRGWDHSYRPAPDLSGAQELSCEDLIRGKITKITPCEDEIVPGAESGA